MATLQVKGMDEELYRALSARAARENRSISQQVVTLIQEHLASPPGSAQRATEEFLALAGSWCDERSSEEIVEDIRNQRNTGKRFTGKEDVFA